MQTAEQINRPQTGQLDIANDPPPGISQAEWEKWLKRHESRSAAAMVPLPGPLAEAFAVAPRKLHAFEFVKLTLPLIPLLQEINSPILDAVTAITRLDPSLTPEQRADAIAALPDPRAIPGETAGQASARRFNETMELVFCFTRPLREVRRALRQGRAEFTEAALEAIGEKLSLNDMDALADLQRACGEHFARHFLTRVEYEADTSNGDGSFPSPPAPKMASAGG